MNYNMNRNIFKITICFALILASCAKDEQVEGIHSQEQDLHTVTVNFNMPDGKPGFGEISDTKSSADSLFTAEVIPATRAVTGGWGDGDVMLMEISAGSTQARLTLEYTGAGYWTLDKDNSYVKYTGETFASYNELAVSLFVGDTQEDDFQIDPDEPLTMNIDWKSEVTAPTVKCIYAPQMVWSIAEGVVTLTSDAATPEKWTKTDNNSWTTSLARLRVNTGTGNAGDVVTLTSSVFTTALGNKPADNIYTAVTDEAGNAYFYGTTESNDALTDNFTVELTKMSVPVPEDSGMEPCSVTRSIELDEDEENLIITPGTSLVLFKATKYNPIKLVSGKAYKILAEARRNTEVNESLSVIDGSCEDFDLITAQIEAALAADITEFTVINQLAVSNSIAGSVVGSAISQLVSGQITLTLEDATDVPEGAFRECHALKQVSVPMAESIGEYAFKDCTGLTEVTFGAVLTNVDNEAFKGLTTNCYLTLAAGQTDISFMDGNLKWAGKSWKSITVGDKVYTQETGFVKLTIAGTETYAVIDGMYGHYTGEDGTEEQFNTYRDDVKTQIAAAYTAGINSFYVINELGTYKYEKKTIVNMGGGVSMERISQVTSSVVGQAFTAYANENTTARVSITLVDATSVPKSAFNGCTALTDINLDKVASIGEYAFEGCTALTSVTTAATQIGRSAFYGCTNLQSATFTSDNTEIVAYAFSGCTKLTTVSWNKVTSIGDNAFSNCTALENVSSNTVTTVGNSAFSMCTSLQTVRLPEVGELWNTFSLCSALEDVYSPKVTTLTSVVFENCTSLKQLTLGNVTSVNLEEYTHSFTGANTAGCDLTLGAGSAGDPDENSNTWAGKQWQSITLN